MSSPSAVLLETRLAAGLSQRELAQRAGTSQPAIARYERGHATPSWGTLTRIAKACGTRLTIEAQPVPDPGDVALAKVLLQLTPEERLESLRSFASLRAEVLGA